MVRVFTTPRGQLDDKVAELMSAGYYILRYHISLISDDWRISTIRKDEYNSWPETVAFNRAQRLTTSIWESRL